MLTFIPRARDWLLQSWREWYKIYSVWGIVLLGAWPDVYDWLIVSGTYDQLPESLKWGGRILMVITLIARFVNQREPEGLRPQVDPDDY